jgi:hypothetical protein
MTQWTEEIVNDIDVLQMCAEGKWLKCKICHVTIITKHDYGTRRWKEHKSTQKHMKNAGKGTQSIFSFLVPKNSFADVTVAVPKAKPCPGIFDDDEHPGLLKLMTMYGEFGDLKVSITSNNNCTIAYVHGCAGKAVPKRPNVSKLATSCDECFQSTKDQKGDGYKFNRRVKDISKIGVALEALEANELKDHTLKPSKSYLKSDEN